MLVICCFVLSAALWEVMAMASRLKLPSFWTPSGRAVSESGMAWVMRWNCSRPRVHRVERAPMEKMQTMTPIMRASCCFQGVAPMRVAGLEVLAGVAGVGRGDADDAADGDASAPKAGAVHPLTRKMAEVAISVAMVMPETGEAEEPTMPTMRRADGDEEEAEDDDEQRGRGVGEWADVGAGNGLELQEEEHQDDEHGAAAEDDDGREIVFGAGGAGGGEFAAGLPQPLS